MDDNDFHVLENKQGITIRILPSIDTTSISLMGI